MKMTGDLRLGFPFSWPRVVCSGRIIFAAFEQAMALEDRKGRIAGGQIESDERAHLGIGQDFLTHPIANRARADLKVHGDVLPIQPPGFRQHFFNRAEVTFIYHTL